MLQLNHLRMLRLSHLRMLQLNHLRMLRLSHLRMLRLRQLRHLLLVRLRRLWLSHLRRSLLFHLQRLPLSCPRDRFAYVGSACIASCKCVELKYTLSCFCIISFFSSSCSRNSLAKIVFFV